MVRNYVDIEGIARPRVGIGAYVAVGGDVGADAARAVAGGELWPPVQVATLMLAQWTPRGTRRTVRPRLKPAVRPAFDEAALGRKRSHRAVRPDRHCLLLGGCCR